MGKLAALFAFALALEAGFHTPGVSAQGPTQITECQTITEPGSYVLANTLTQPLPFEPCLVISADFITIDLAGFP
jgi:hypothetical protein